jgi:spore coat polysaccharide biosynthesis protein SpsF
VSALVVVQARMSSTRLPGKSLADVGGRPMVLLLLDRLARSRGASDVVLATSTDAADDPLADAGAADGVRVHRGPRDDVLRRFAGAIGDHDGPVVRLTGDCPFTDPAIVDATIALFSAEPGCAYANNVDPRTYPDGLDVEVVDAGVLRELDAAAVDPADREHVTALIRRQPERYRTETLTNDEDLGALRWTVDYPEDLEFVRAVAERLGRRLHDAAMGDILAAVRTSPSLSDMHAEWGPRG